MARNLNNLPYFTDQSVNIFSEYENQKITKDIEDEESAAKYRYKTPEPNYSQFGKMKTEYIDDYGREYILARGLLDFFFFF